VRILVTGREGQIVRSLVERASAHKAEVITLGRPDLDLAGPESAIVSAIEAARPEAIVSAAAYTQVDKAQSEPELAFAINEAGAAAVARAARKLDVPLVHLSTDYVFDGGKSTPYLETDPAEPTTVYGASKLAGEKAILAGHGNCAVLRAAWVYSPFGTNFVKTMLRLAETRDEVAVVADQRGNPTGALHIADGVLAVIAGLRSNDDPNRRGVFHMTAAGEASWADLAQRIFEASTEAGGPSAKVKRIATADYPTAARRPANSRLDCSKLAQVYGLRLPDWRDSLQVVVKRLVQSGASGAGSR
jgi:dTDP-4-dehydrorhamnose reductase